MPGFENIDKLECPATPCWASWPRSATSVPARWWRCTANAASRLATAPGPGSRAPGLGPDTPGGRQDGDPGCSARGAGGDARAGGRVQVFPPLVAAAGGGERGAVPGAGQGWPGRGAERSNKGLRGSLTDAFTAAGIDLRTLETVVRRGTLDLVERRLNANYGDRSGAWLPCDGCGGRATRASGARR